MMPSGLHAKALDWVTRRNMDFADALLLAKAQACGGLASFDRKFAKAARAVGGIEMRGL
jgi:predicted nucleic acid-binding protein